MEDCDVCIVAGHEAAHGMRTPYEQAKMAEAWFSDVPTDQHPMRIQEEHAFLTRKKDAFLQKVPPKAQFKGPSAPVGIDSEHAYAISFVDAQGAEAYAKHFLEIEQEDLLHYFRECMGRARSRQQIKYVGIDLNTMLQVDPILRPILVPLLGEMKELYKELPEDPELGIEDTRFDSIKRTKEQRPFHEVTLSKLPVCKEPEPELGDDYGFSLMVCPLPIFQTKQRVDTKRCQWKRLPSTPIFAYNKDTVPVVRQLQNHFLVARNHGDHIYVDLIKVDKSLTVLSYVVLLKEPVKDCYWDDQTNYVGLLFDRYVMLISEDRSVSLVNVSYEEYEEKMPTLTALFLGYTEMVLGTNAGEVIIFKQYTKEAYERPLVHHSLPSTAPIHHVHRTGCNLYATNVMNVINVETADADSFARGHRLQTNGQIFAADRVVGIDSCGALMASLNKYGTLQIQPNRFCPDPENPNKRLDAAIFTAPKKEAKKEGEKEVENGVFFQYRAVYLGRRQLCCLYPDGRIQSIWYILSEKA